MVFNFTILSKKKKKNKNIYVIRIVSIIHSVKNNVKYLPIIN